jgi:CheY-like chemotaxis protein
VTERRRAEEEVANAKETAEAANRTKSMFLANMSHELRTPLNAILGYSEMLQEEAETQQLESFLPDLQKIHGAGKHLLLLINDILDLSKIEAGKMDLYLENFSIAGLIDEIVGTIRPLVESNSNVLEVRCPSDIGSMFADMTKTRQSLFNLLSNAAKFTKKGSITLEVSRRTMEGREWIWFRVLDTGIGMTSEQLVKLFQTFSQADASTTRKFGGSGLGLALTRRFCQLMGGDVTVSSVPHESSTFTIKVPSIVTDIERQEARAPLQTKPVVAPAEIARPEVKCSQPLGTGVLVIDDDIMQRELMMRFLTSEGFLVQTASDGAEGLKLAKQSRPIAITLDVMMPGMDGWSVLSAFKADPAVCNIPVIMLTMLDDRKRGYALGASNYITKPFDRKSLAQLLKGYRCPNPPCSVLLVEDDLMTRQMMRSMLEKLGWSVSEAENGRLALQQVAQKRPALILLDLVMPEMDGFEFASELHRNTEWQSIPIVVLTGKDLTAEELTLLNGNVQNVIDKGDSSQEEMMLQVRDLIVGLTNSSNRINVPQSSETAREKGVKANA